VISSRNLARGPGVKDVGFPDPPLWQFAPQDHTSPALGRLFTAFVRPYEDISTRSILPQKPLTVRSIHL
jgi:hypothetical protein